MKTNRAFLYTFLTGAFALALVILGATWSAPVYAQTTADDAITEEENAGLQFMGEEEKLARDVYLTLGDIWGLQIFANISRAEQTHMDAVLTMMDRYGLEAPATINEIGVFTDDDLQALYDQLIETGSLSVADALKVGIAIEEIDILDLEEHMAHTDKADILQVYTNLKRGSESHLRAFVSTLERQTGEVHQPQYMTQDAYDAAMNGSNGRGGKGNSNGAGQGNSYGDGSTNRSGGQGQGGQGRGGHGRSGQGSQNQQGGQGYRHQN